MLGAMGYMEGGGWREKGGGEKMMNLYFSFKKYIIMSVGGNGSILFFLNTIFWRKHSLASIIIKTVDHYIFYTRRRMR